MEICQPLCICGELRSRVLLEHEDTARIVHEVRGHCCLQFRGWGLGCRDYVEVTGKAVQTQSPFRHARLHTLGEKIKVGAISAYMHLLQNHVGLCWLLRDDSQYFSATRCHAFGSPMRVHVQTLLVFLNSGQNLSRIRST